MHGKSEWCMIQAQHLACSEQTKRAISFLLNHKMIPTFHSEFAPELTGTLPKSTVPLTTLCVDSLVGRGCLRHLSDDQNPDCLFYIWDYTTQSYTVEIIKRNYKDSYEPTTTMECHKDFERCACWSSSVLCFLRNSSISITLYDLLVPVRWSRLIQSFQVTWTNDRAYWYILSETNTVPRRLVSFWEAYFQGICFVVLGRVLE